MEKQHLLLLAGHMKQKHGATHMQRLRHKLTLCRFVQAEVLCWEYDAILQPLCLMLNVHAFQNFLHNSSSNSEMYTSVPEANSTISVQESQNKGRVVDLLVTLTGYGKRASILEQSWLKRPTRNYASASIPRRKEQTFRIHKML